MREFRNAWKAYVIPKVRFHRGDLPPSARLHRIVLMDAYLSLLRIGVGEAEFLFTSQLLDAFAYGDWRVEGEWQMYVPNDFDEQRW